jgi:hypothetical protein
MRYLSAFVAVSICLNIYVLWKLNESYKPKTFQNTRFVSKKDVQVSPLESELEAKKVVQLMDISLGEMRSTLEKLEARIESIEAESPTFENQEAISSTQNILTDRVMRSLTSPSDSDRTNEDWFWNSSGDGGHEKSLSLSQSDGLEVDSIVCRSEWCRVEIVNETPSEEGSDPDHELQLKISESLGRDTVIRWGKKDGNRTVLFIQ